jgi:membrane-associated phospholipid phosphatase
MPPVPAASEFWHLVTRLGEAQILLPAALMLCWWLARRAEARPLVQRWLQGVALAALVTTATKVAFMGWGIGSAALNFTGISGHAMFAAAIYPPLLYLVAGTHGAAWQRAGWLAGCGVALLIGVSRVMVGAHSASEVAAGLLVGGTVSASALWMAQARQASMPLWLPACVAVWLALTPVHAPASTTHDMVTRLALTLSGRQQPHTRWEMLHAHRLRQLASPPSLPAL